jgi:hypothetical protein
VAADVEAGGGDVDGAGEAVDADGEVAAAQLAGEDFWVGLDRWRVDVAGQAIAPVTGLCSTTAAGLARRFTEGQWQAVETGVGGIHTAMLAALRGCPEFRGTSVAAR